MLLKSYLNALTPYQAQKVGSIFDCFIYRYEKTDIQRD